MSDEKSEPDTPRLDDAPAGFGSVPFEGWLTIVASELSDDLAGRHHYEASVPGSVSEAAAFLLSAVGLAPDAEGNPTLAGAGGASRFDGFEALATILYTAAFPAAQHLNEDLHIYATYEAEFWQTEPREESELREVVNAAGVLVERTDARGARSVLVFHEPGLELTEIACESFEDLRGLYRLSISKGTLNLHGFEQTQTMQDSLLQFGYTIVEPARHQEAFEPSPHPLYEVQVRTIGWQSVQYESPRLPPPLTLSNDPGGMKRSVVQNHHARLLLLLRFSRQSVQVAENLPAVARTLQHPVLQSLLSPIQAERTHEVDAPLRAPPSLHPVLVSLTL